MEEDFYSLGADQRAALAREAIEKGEPLAIRWAELQPDFGNRWQPRAAAAAEWLATAASVVDFGCGTMNLEACLRPGQTYVPVDLTRRDDRTLILDLNRPSDLARLPPADACALLGVLEYIYAPHQLLTMLRDTYGQVVVTFNVLRCDESPDDRLAHGWVNHFTRTELLALFMAHGFTATREYLFENRRREHLFDLRRLDI